MSVWATKLGVHCHWQTLELALIFYPKPFTKWSWEQARSQNPDGKRWWVKDA